MRRREVLAAAGMALAAPRIVRGESARRLTFVPSGAGLAPLDTTWTPARVTRIHASLVFDTLYGMDDTLTPHPQMLDGHTTEQDGRLWTLKLRPGLRFHDGSPVLARDALASIRRFCVRDNLGQALMAAALPPCQAVPATAGGPCGVILHAAGCHAGTARQHRCVAPGIGNDR